MHSTHRAGSLHLPRCILLTEQVLYIFNVRPGRIPADASEARYSWLAFPASGVCGEILVFSVSTDPREERKKLGFYVVTKQFNVLHVIGRVGAQLCFLQQRQVVWSSFETWFGQVACALVRCLRRSVAYVSPQVYYL